MAKVLGIWSFLLIAAFALVNIANCLEGQEEPKKGEFNATCTANTDCDATIGLTCNTGRCGCARPAEMTYDADNSTCVVKVTYSCEKIDGMTAPEFKCGKHAACVSETHKGKTCKCATGYSKNEHEECLGDFKTSCDKDEPCNTFALLSCHAAQGETAGKCGCMEPKEQIYQRGKCYALAGGICNTKGTFKLECLGNATCSIESKVDGAEPSGKCTCNKGFKPDQNKMCVNGVTPLISSGIFVVMAVVLQKMM